MLLKQLLFKERQMYIYIYTNRCNETLLYFVQNQYQRSTCIEIKKFSLIFGSVGKLIVHVSRTKCSNIWLLQHQNCLIWLVWLRAACNRTPKSGSRSTCCIQKFKRWWWRELQEVITSISCTFNVHLNAIKIKFFEHLLPITWP